MNEVKNLNVTPRTSHATLFRRQASGFTLLELIAVLLVLAIMTSAVVPLFRQSLTTLRTDRATVDMVALLKYAQERAVTDSTEYRFYMDKDAGAYWVQRLAGLNEDREKVFELASARKTLPENLEMQVSKARKDRELDMQYITFFASGACDIAKISIKRPTGSAIVIQTKGKLGQFEIKD